MKKDATNKYAMQYDFTEENATKKYATKKDAKRKVQQIKMSKERCI